MDGWGGQNPAQNGTGSGSVGSAESLGQLVEATLLVGIE